MAKTEREKMLAHEPYWAAALELVEMRQRAQEQLYRCVAWRRRDCLSWSDDWRQHHHRRGQCGDEGDTREGSGGGQPLLRHP